MAVKEVLKVSRKTFFNPTGWLGVEGLKTNFKTTWDLIKDLFSPAKPEYTETFEEAMSRLGLSEADIQRMSRIYFIYTIFFAVFGLLSFITAFYLLFIHGSFSGWVLALACAGLFWVQAFRYNFWLFQMKHRKLGCTFAEWRKGKISEEQGPSL